MTARKALVEGAEKAVDARGIVEALTKVCEAEGLVRELSGR